MQGTVILIFQPSEERGEGAKAMIKEGVVDNVDAIFGIHILSQYPIGVVASRPGHFLAGCGSFKANIYGKGGHAAIPQESIDPILAASTSVISLQNIVSREIDPFDSQVFIYGVCCFFNLKFTLSIYIVNFTHVIIWTYCRLFLCLSFKQGLHSMSSQTQLQYLVLSELLVEIASMHSVKE